MTLEAATDLRLRRIEKKRYLFSVPKIEQKRSRRGSST
jgi:hypothetical protein